MSPKKDRQNISRNGGNVSLMNYWKDAGAFVSPKGITNDSKSS
jgi:hypothetical protein